jgi:hypothetical protein
MTGSPRRPRDPETDMPPIPSCSSRSSRSSRSLLLGLLLAAPVALAGVDEPRGLPVFWVGAAAPCNFTDLQTAIDAVPDNAEIRIAANQAYDDVAVDVTNKSLVIAGGWSDCTGTVASDPVVLVGAQGGTALPVIRVSSLVTPRVVILRRLHLTGGRRSGVELGGLVQLRVERSVIDANSAQVGGGIRVNGAGPDLTELRVVETLVGNANDPADPGLAGNAALGNGGGIYCQNARVQLRAAVLRNNDSGALGGGLYADGCEVVSGGNVYSFPGIGVATVLVEANRAVGDGGGLFATGGSSVLLSPGTPALFAIRGNRARAGAGVALFGLGTTLVGEGLDLVDNHAQQRGGAGQLVEGAQLTLRRGPPAKPPAPPDGTDGGITISTYCPPLAACNQVSLNRAGTSTGGAFYVSASILTLQHTRLDGNFAGNGSQLLLTSGSIARVENSLIDGNDSNGGDLVRMVNGASLLLNSSTLVDNLTGNRLIRTFSDSGGNVLDLRNSIVWNPGTTVLEATAADSVDATCLNAHEATSVPALTHDPGFVDAAAADYRLHVSSANIDACADPFKGVPAVDILGVPRPTDLGPDVGAGDFDRGAFELGDLIFAHDFGEPPPF